MPWFSIHTQPATWFVCFHRSSPTWWVQRFVPGRWKHVNCFGHIPGQDVWVFYDFALDGATVAVVPDRQNALVQAHMEAFTMNALMVQVEAPRSRQRRWQPISVCVSEVAAVIGVKSRALRASRLLADLLRDGGRIISGAEYGKGATGGPAAAGQSRPA